MASARSLSARNPSNAAQASRGEAASRLWTRRRALLLLSLGVLALAGWLGYAAGYPYVLRVHHERAAEEATRAHDFSAARSHLERCLEVWPGHARLTLQLARTYRREGDFVAADAQLGRAEQLGCDQRSCGLERLLLQAQTGELDVAEATLVSHLLSGHPEELLILEALVHAYLDVHHLREVQHWTTEWAQRYPGDWRALFFRGRSYNMESRFDQATADYQSALRLNPDAYEVHKQLGDLLREKGLLRDAVPHLDFCRQRHPEDPKVVWNLARCLRNLGKAEVAQQLLEDWLARHGPTDANVLSLRGRLERDQGDPARTLPFLRQAEKLAPRDPDTIALLSAVHRELGQEEDARRYDRIADDLRHQFTRLDTLSKILAVTPDDVETRHEIGVILLRLGHEKRGVEYLRSVLRMDGAHRATHLALADYHESKGERDQARDHRLAAEGKLRAVGPR